jgi:chemotaxis signal transduction protein
VIHLLVRLGGGLQYALPVDAVREVVPYRVPRRVPSDEPYLLGAVALRDVVVSIHDIGPLLGGGPTPEPKVVAVLAANERHGIVLEGVDGMRELEQPPARRGAVLRGLVADGDDVLALLDGKALVRALAPPRRRSSE